jgi:hypothetical protein
MRRPDPRFYILLSRTLIVANHMLSRSSAQPDRRGATRARGSRPAAAWARAGYAGLFLVLALVALQSARMGGAGLLVQTAAIEVERWQPPSRPPSALQMRRAEKYFADSLRLDAGNPWALEGLGALHLARMRASSVPREALAAARSAHLRFRQALVQRPTSPYLWANVALSKLYLDEHDEELMTALRHADALGPWEPASQQTVLFVGLAVWQELDSGMRQALARAIERGAVRNAQKMLEIVKVYRRFELVCDIDRYRNIAGTDCRRSSTTGKAGASPKSGSRS